MDDCHASTITQSAAETLFGFAVPRAITQLLSVASESQRLVATGVRFSPDVVRPANCPPELFVVGETGMDGVVCGCVMHDPKLAGEVPLALFDPGAGRADYLGLDTRRSIGVLIGMRLSELSGDERDMARAVAEEMSFDPDELPAEQPLDARPRVPPGWRIAATADGLGVVAQQKHFSPDQEYDEEPDAFDIDPARALDRADAALGAGFPATALWHARNAFVFADEGVDRNDLAERLRSAYVALGRDAWSR